MAEDNESLIAEYEWLRLFTQQLDAQTEHVDRRLVEIERRLPDSYTFSDDPPCDAEYP